MLWRTARSTLDLSSCAVIMGILNVTPDSFSDGGEFLDQRPAVDRALAMLAEGAAIIDIGGESTRPGAAPVPADEEMARVFPVIEALVHRAPDCLISVDTSKAAVAAGALARGAAIVNDVTALRGDLAMAKVVREAGAGVVLMHMQGDPRMMQLAPHYEDVAAEVRAFFETAVNEADLDPACVAFDPGIGFGKTPAHNLTLLRALDTLSVRDRPLVLGVSRKGFLSKVAGVHSLPDRLWPTLAITALARQKGVRVLRVHDVAPNMAALRMAEALLPLP